MIFEKGVKKVTNGGSKKLQSFQREKSSFPFLCRHMCNGKLVLTALIFGIYMVFNTPKRRPK